jgi:hypothetical protein
MTGLACFVTNMASTPISLVAADPAVGAPAQSKQFRSSVPLTTRTVFHSRGKYFSADLYFSDDVIRRCLHSHARPRVTMPAIRIAGQQLLGSNANVYHEVLDRRQSSFHAPASPPSPPVHVAPPVTSCAGIFVSSTFQLANCFGGRPPPLLTQKELFTKCRPDIRDGRPSATSHSLLPSVIDSRISS